MKFKNFFLSCSTAGGRSRKLEEKQQKYGNLRPGSPPLAPLPPIDTTTVHPTVTADLREPRKLPLSNSYSSYSCASSSSNGSSKSGGYNSSSISKNKRALDSRSSRHRAERQKSKCTSRQCCVVDKDFHQKFPSNEFDVNPATDDLGWFL